MISNVSYTREGTVYSCPTIRTESRYEVADDDDFGTYQDRHVHGDELVSSGDSINPISSQVKMRPHPDIL